MMYDYLALEAIITAQYFCSGKELHLYGLVPDC